MRAKDLKGKLQKLPKTSGVYFFIGSRKKILYIGKATSLRERVKSYFNSDLADTRGRAIVKMVKEAKEVDYTKTDSVLEALILEANFIKQYKPAYNVRARDDKSFNYVVVTKEDFPRVLTVRGKDLSRKFPSRTRKYVFGPFPQGAVFKEAMRIIQKLFPYYDTAKPVTEITSKAGRGKLKFNQQLGLYPNMNISKSEYAQSIRHLKLFFDGKKAALVRQLKKEMVHYAGKQEFEKAGSLKRTIFALNHIQDVSLLKREVRELSAGGSVFRIEAYDIAHTSGMGRVGAMVVIQDGEPKKNDYRKFRIKGEGGGDTAALEETLERRLEHSEWHLPKLIVMDGGKAQLNTAKGILIKYGYRIPVVSVVKNERHQPREIFGDKNIKKEHEKEILLANYEVHRFVVSYHRKVRGKL